MRQRDLLAAIAGFDPIRVQGTFERHTSLRWEELKPSAAGGRWGARRAYEVLYLGRPRGSVVIEAYRHLARPSTRPPAPATRRRSLTNLLPFGGPYHGAVRRHIAFLVKPEPTRVAEIKWQPCQNRPKSSANSDNPSAGHGTDRTAENPVSMRDSALRPDPASATSHARGRRFETRRAHWRNAR